MGAFGYRNGTLHCEGTPLDEVAADVGTPLYAYGRNRLIENYNSVHDAFGGTDHLVCFAIKANANPAIVREFAGLGAGADVVSGGELLLARRAGIPPERIVFSGVGKTDDEIGQAVREGILAVNVESSEELDVLQRSASGLRTRVGISLRINPQINPNTHPHLATGLRDTKFGFPADQAGEACRKALSLSYLNLIGLHCHIGSMVLELEPFQEAARYLAVLAAELIDSGVPLRFIDIGGGLGLDYGRIVVQDPQSAAPAAFPGPGVLFAELLPIFRPLGLKVVFEPGRWLVADAGALVTRVLYTKKTETRSFAIVDAGMNDLIRPSLYGAYHQIVPVQQKTGPLSEISVVGPVCEAGDFFAFDRPLPSVQRGDLLVITGAGAYGYSLSSNYNGRPRPAEVMIDETGFRIIRDREPVELLWRGTDG